MLGTNLPILEADESQIQMLVGFFFKSCVLTPDVIGLRTVRSINDLFYPGRR